MFEPKLFLNLAESLKDYPKDESKVRTSVSRSYYSIFLGIRVRIENLTGKDLENRRNIHETIINGLKTSKDKQTASFGTNLDMLRNYRNQADYHLRVSLNPLKAELAYKIAEDLFNELKKLDATSLKSQFPV